LAGESAIFCAMKIITWNINSVRLRLGLVKQLLETEKPDILALQETKVVDELFPAMELKAMGYPYLHTSGQKSYNGVAFISRVPLAGPQAQRFVNDDRRHISAMLPGGVEIHNFYVPAGGDIPDPKQNPKFAHKLKFVEEMTSFFSKQRKKSDKIVIMGDFNIAPLEHDVWSHKQLLKVVSHTPPELERIEKLRASLGWLDTSRLFAPPDTKLYSWWSYRNQDWRKSDRGRRLDHIWASPALEGLVKRSYILKDCRDWKTTSDHVPVITEFKIA
jgi:exodeoxyribonuclease-3